MNVEENLMESLRIRRIHLSKGLTRSVKCDRLRCTAETVLIETHKIVETKVLDCFWKVC